MKPPRSAPPPSRAPVAVPWAPLTPALPGFSTPATLPGLAGFILSVGMAVDSNILIFERMKEELRMGKSWKTAMELGFGRAWDSIKDANVATLITAMAARSCVIVVVMLSLPKPLPTRLKAMFSGR